MDFPIEEHNAFSDPASKLNQRQRKIAKLSEPPEIADWFNSQGDVGYEAVDDDEYLKLAREKRDNSNYVNEKLEQFKRKPFDLRLNMEALKKVTSPTDKDRIALENGFEVVTKTPERVKAVGFLSDFNEFKKMVIETNDGERYEFSVSILRSAVEGTSPSKKRGTDIVTGIRFGSPNGNGDDDVFPGVPHDKFVNIMKKLSFGGKKLGDDVNYFIHKTNNENERANIPARNVDVSAQFANYP